MSIHSVHMNGIRGALKNLRRGGDCDQTVSTLFGTALGWMQAGHLIGLISWDEYARLNDLAVNAAMYARRGLSNA